MKYAFFSFAELLLAFQISIDHTVNLSLIRDNPKDKVVLLKYGIGRKWLTLLYLLGVLDNILKRLVEYLIIRQPIRRFIVWILILLANGLLVGVPIQVAGPGLCNLLASLLRSSIPPLPVLSLPHDS